MPWRLFRHIVFALPLFCAIALGQSSWEDKNLAGEKAFQEGKLSDANRLFNDALQDAQRFGPKDVRLAPIYNNLALVAFIQNNFIASESLYQKAIDAIEASGGQENPLLLPVLDNLTRLYVKQWAFGKAIHTAWRVCHIREKKLGAENAETVAGLEKLATLYVDSVRLLPHTAVRSEVGSKAAISTPQHFENEDATDDPSRLGMAESLYRRVLAAQERNFGAENSRLVDVLDHLGEVLHAEENSQEAQRSYARAIGIVEKSFGPEDLKLVGPLQAMAELKAEDGAYDESEALYLRALKIDKAKLGAKDSSLVSLLTGYGALLEKMQRPDEAKKLADRAASLSSVKTAGASTPVSQTSSVPYVLRFERSIYDRYSGIHQTCLLVRADGRFRVEDQQRQGTTSGSVVAPVHRNPDVMNMPVDEQNTVDIGGGAGARLPAVFESSVEGGGIQQLLAILSAKDIRGIQGSYPPRGEPNYYGTEKIMMSVLRDDGVQSFAFPDVNTRQPFESGLKPLLKWLNSAEKHKGSAIKGAVPNNCSPDMPQAAPMQFSTRLLEDLKSGAKAQATGNPHPASGALDKASTFKVDVNLVLVRAVVHDSQGRAVGTLHQDDFRLLDNRKPQAITRFSVEPSASVPGTIADPAGNSAVAENTKQIPSPRNIAFLFDDIHLSLTDLERARSGADRQMATLPSTDQAAIFTTSTHTTLDFTADRGKLRETLLHIQPRKTTGSGGHDCPEVDVYMADLIYNKSDEDALGAATGEALMCAYGSDVRFGAAAETMAKSAAQQQIANAEIQSQLVLRALQNALQRLAASPGQHTLVLVSSGFVAPGREQDFSKIIDLALHADIIISTLDARGLYNIDSVASNSRANLDYRRESASANAELLATLADATGGTFFHNSNDLEAGFQRVTETPDYSYILGFAPEDRELDGRFHSLSVTLNTPQKVTVQARKGYYAPKHATQ